MEIQLSTAQATHWYTTAIPIVQSLATLALTATIFGLTRGDKKRELDAAAADKTRERKAVWFHKLVVDPSLEQLPKFSEDVRTYLEAKVVEHQALRSMGTAADELLAEAMNVFQVKLSREVSALAARTKVIDPAFAKTISQIGDKHEEIVTKWLQRLTSAQPFDGKAPLREVIQALELELLQLIYDYEFKSIPVVSNFTTQPS